MAGVKGRSGGPRPGSGRPRKPVQAAPGAPAAAVAPPLPADAEAVLPAPEAGAGEVQAAPVPVVTPIPPGREWQAAPTSSNDPLELLLHIANSGAWDTTLRLRAAVEAAKIMYSEEGKKAAVGKRAAQITAAARLTSIAPPPRKVA